jgi:hypothetical protein
MKAKYITQIPLILLFLTAVAFLVSCGDDDENASSKTELLSFGPSGVKPGEEIVFIGKNLKKVTSIVFSPSVEVPSSSFTSTSDEKITLIVPTSVETGKVMLKTMDGQIESKTIFDVEVLIKITSIPSEAKPGTNITITGDYLNWIEEVKFPRDLVVTKEEFVSQSQTELVVTVPMESQTGYLEFAYSGTKPGIGIMNDPITIKLPVVNVLSPQSVKHSENLTLEGGDLDLVTEIKFGGGAVVAKSEFVSQTETAIVVSVPASTTTGKLTLTAPSGLEVVTGSELNIILPNVTSLSPSDVSAHTPGSTLTLVGTDLDLVAKLTFPGVTAPVTTFVSQSSTSIEVVIPAGAEGGTLVMTTVHNYVVPVKVPFGNQLTLATVMFDDAVKAPLGAGGGWGGVVTDVNNTEKPRVGTKSVKVTFAGSWGGGGQFGNWSGQSVSTAGASFYAFSIYGGPGTDGKAINVNVAGKQVEVVIVEGAWKDVQIPLSSFNSPAGISEIWFQDRGWSGTVYIDHIGLK